MSSHINVELRSTIIKFEQLIRWTATRLYATITTTPLLIFCYPIPENKIYAKIILD
jgi:hypothetical protein